MYWKDENIEKDASLGPLKRTKLKFDFLSLALKI